MSIDLKAIRTKFKLLAQQKVGSYLAQVGAGGDVPAVIDARPVVLGGVAMPMPPYPYITVDVTILKDDNYYDSNRYFDPVTEQEVHQMRKTLLVFYRMYGGVTSSENADHCQYVMNELMNQFRLPLVIGDLEDTLGLTPELVTDLETNPIRKSTYYLETAAFNVRCDIIDSISDPDTFVIEEVNLDGSVVLQDEETLDSSVIIKP